MNLIRCQKDCAYQSDGYCGLDRAAAVTCAELNQCSFYQGKAGAVHPDLPYRVPPVGDPADTPVPYTEPPRMPEIPRPDGAQFLQGDNL